MASVPRLLTNWFAGSLPAQKSVTVVSSGESGSTAPRWQAPAQLFHEAGIHDLDQWLSDFAACDYEYLAHFYRTREKLPFLSFWCDGQPLVKPLQIQEFHPTQWVSRWKGTVV